MRILKTFILFTFFSKDLLFAQIANFVTNGGFEDYISCTGGSVMYINKARGWRTLDSLDCCGVGYFNTCLPNVPSDGTRYQWPYKGKGFGMASFYCTYFCNPYPNRGYFRNRLKEKLIKDKIYCVKLFYNLSNVSNVGIDSFGAYFGEGSLDTITKGFGRITYLTPQVQNPANNFATDTLNWTLLSGTFKANGNNII